MNMKRVVLLSLASAIGWFLCIGLVVAQQGKQAVYWRSQLKVALAHIKKEPNSPFWHNQAGIAYDALGDSSRAEAELKLSAKLDPYNPISYYTLYAFYQRKGTLSQQRRALLSALDNDNRNPLGHFELAHVLEEEGYLTVSLNEYQTAKRLVSAVHGNEYTDERGNPYEIAIVRKQVASCINRVAKLISSKQSERRRQSEKSSAGNRSQTLKGCENINQITQALAELQKTNWSHISLAWIQARWPTKLEPFDCATQRCRSLAHEGRIIDGQTQCGQKVDFDQKPHSAPGVDEALTVTIYFSSSRPEEAAAAAKSLATALGLSRHEVATISRQSDQEFLLPSSNKREHSFMVIRLAHRAAVWTMWVQVQRTLLQKRSN